MRTEEINLTLERVTKEGGERIDFDPQKRVKLSIWGEGKDESYLLDQEELKQIKDFVEELEEEGYFEEQQKSDLF